MLAGYGTECRADACAANEYLIMGGVYGSEFYLPGGSCEPCGNYKEADPDSPVPDSITDKYPSTLSKYTSCRDTTCGAREMVAESGLCVACKDWERMQGDTTLQV